jgi:DNA-binding YbaB/EbfC family protein
MRGNIGQLMKQAQAMQQNMQKMQDQLAQLEVEGQSGAGLVKIQMTCKYDVKRVSIDPSLVGDAEATIAEKMSSVTAGMGLPPGMKLPF